MSGVEKITEKIIGEGETAYREILARARQEAFETLKNGEAEGKRRAEELERRGRKEAEEQCRAIDSMSRLQIRRDILAAKQELIEEAISGALSRLEGLTGQEYASALLSMLRKYARGDETLVLSPKSLEALPRDFLEQANGALRAAGKKGELALSSQAPDIAPGFLLEQQGAVTNCTFGFVARALRDELETEAAKILFLNEK